VPAAMQQRYLLPPSRGIVSSACIKKPPKAGNAFTCLKYLMTFFRTQLVSACTSSACPSYVAIYCKGIEVVRRPEAHLVLSSHLLIARKMAAASPAWSRAITPLLTSQFIAPSESWLA